MSFVREAARVTMGVTAARETNMPYDYLVMDPFIRTHRGARNEFVCRENVEHVELTSRLSAERRERELEKLEDFHVTSGPTAQPILVAA